MINLNFLNTLNDYSNQLRHSAAGDSSKIARIDSALQKIKEYSEALNQNDDKVGLLMKIDREVDRLDDQSANPQVKVIQNIVSENIVNSFLTLEDEQKSFQLEDPEFAKKMEGIIKNADPEKIWSSNTGDTLLHLLIRSKSEATRKLSLICIDSGCNVNKQNMSGSTPLHFAANHGDSFLVNELLKRGASPRLVAQQSLSAIELALNNSNDIALTIAFADPGQKVNGKNVAAYLITEMDDNDIDVTKIIQLLRSTSPTTETINTIWMFSSDLRSDSFKDSHDKLEKIVSWLLEQPIDNTDFNTKLVLIKWLVNRLIERNCSLNGDEKLLSLLIDSTYFQLIIDDKGKSLALDLLKRIESGIIKVTSELEAKVSQAIDTDAIRIYLKLEKLKPKHTALGLRTFLSKTSDKYSQIELLLDQLETRNFPHSDTLRITFAGVYPVSRIKEYRRVRDHLEAQKQLTEIDSDVYRDILESFVKNNRWDWIAEVDCVRGKYIDNQSSKLTYHLLMDKLFLAETENYKGFTSAICARAIINTLQNTLKSVTGTNTNPELAQACSKLCISLIPLLKDYIVFSSTQDPTDLHYRLKDRLGSLSSGQSILIPTGKPGHATCLLVRKVTDNMFDITNYNTGSGVEFHYQGPRLNTFQTYDTITNIPTSSILNFDALFQIAALRDRAGIEMKDVYSLLRKRLGGTRAPASANSEDYEAKQSSGTCAMQCLMAMLRHEVMQMDVGSPQERKALYDIFKTKMLQQFYHDNQNTIDETIQNNLSTVLNKLDAKWSVLKLAEDLETFNQTLSFLASSIDDLGDHENAKMLQEANHTTNFSRYAVLIHASNILCDLWLKNPQKIPQGETRQNPYFQYAIAKLENRQLQLYNLKIYIERFKNDRSKLASELFQLFYRSPFTDFITSEAVARLGDEKEPYTSTGNFLANLNSRRSTTETIADSFIQGLCKQNHTEIAEWAENRWKELKLEVTEVDSFD